MPPRPPLGPTGQRLAFRFAREGGRMPPRPPLGPTGQRSAPRFAREGGRPPPPPVLEAAARQRSAVRFAREGGRADGRSGHTSEPMETVLRLVVAGVLGVAVAAKLRSPLDSAEGMSAFGFRSRQGRWLAFGAAVSLELGLAIAIAAGSERALFAAAGLMALYALSMVGAVLRGRVGEPCGCLGEGSRVGWSAVVRNAVLALGFAAVAVLAG